MHPIDFTAPVKTKKAEVAYGVPQGFYFINRIKKNLVHVKPATEPRPEEQQPSHPVPEPEPQPEPASGYCNSLYSTIIILFIACL